MKDKKTIFKLFLVPIMIGGAILTAAIFAKNSTVQKSMSATYSCYACGGSQGVSYTCATSSPSSSCYTVDINYCSSYSNCQTTTYACYICGGSSQGPGNYVWGKTSTYDSNSSCVKQTSITTESNCKATLVTGVSISGSSSVRVGNTITLTYSVTPSNATNGQVTWSSSNTAVATITAGGTVTGVSEGTVTITATAKDGSGKQGTKSITVNDPKACYICGGSSQGPGNYVWGPTRTYDSNSNCVKQTSITSESSCKATLVTGISVSGSSSVNVGNTITLTYSVTPSNATNGQVTWSSSNTAVATVNSAGTVTGVAEGTVTITATAKDGSGKQGTKSITVNDPKACYICGGSSQGPGNYVWGPTRTYDSNSNCVKQTSITSESSCKATLVTGISVSGSSSVRVGNTITLTYSVTPSNATNGQVTWSSSNTAVATVNSAGTVTGVKAGTATITATAKDGSGVQGTKSITVTDTYACYLCGGSSQGPGNYVWGATSTYDSNSSCVKQTSITTESSCKATLVTGVSISGSSSVNVGNTITLTYSVTPSNATNGQVTWSSGDTSIATITAGGTVTGVKAGVVTITATAKDGSGVQATKSITVSGCYKCGTQYNWLSITPASSCVAQNGVTTLSACTALNDYSCYQCGNSQGGTYQWLNGTPDEHSCGKASQYTTQEACLANNARCYKCGTQYSWTNSPASSCSAESAATSESACQALNDYSCYQCGNSQGGTYQWLNGTPDEHSCGKASQYTTQEACLANNAKCYQCGTTYNWVNSSPSSSCSVKSGITSQSACIALNNYWCYACGNSQHGEYRWLNGTPDPDMCARVSGISLESTCTGQNYACFHCGNVTGDGYVWTTKSAGNICAEVTSATTQSACLGLNDTYACYQCGNSQGGTYRWLSENPDTHSCGKASQYTTKEACLDNNSKCYKCGTEYSWTSSPASNCSAQASATTKTACLALNNYACYVCGNSQSGEYKWLNGNPGGQCAKVSGITTQSACLSNNYACFHCANATGDGYVWTSKSAGNSCSAVTSVTTQSACQALNNYACYACGNSQSGEYKWLNGIPDPTRCAKVSGITTEADCLNGGSDDPVPETKTYTVRYNKNDDAATGTTANSTHKVGVAKNLTANGYKLGGNVFQGWNSKANGSGTSYVNKQSVINLSTTNGAIVDLYAQWHMCPAGQYAVAGDNSCSNCTGNTYTSSPGQTSCTACPEGQVADSTHTGCRIPSPTTVSCPAGTYLIAGGTTEEDCTECPAGYYCPGGGFEPSDEDQGKDPCPAGHTAGGTGLSSESACKIKCNEGFYKDVQTAEACVACPVDTTSDPHIVNYGDISPDGTCYSSAAPREYKCYVCGSNGNETYTWTNKDKSSDASCVVDTSKNSAEKCKKPGEDPGPDNPINPKTGLIGVGGVLLGLAGAAGAAYYIIKKKQISNV